MAERETATSPERNRIGLCAACRYMRQMKSDRGSSFYLCGLSATDPSLPKYPRLPVIQCSGYEQKVLKMRQIAEFVAVLACGLFTGAAVYISLVEHRSRME